MSYVDRVMAAKNPREAILILAKGLDELASAGGGWDDWGDDGAGFPADLIRAGVGEDGLTDHERAEHERALLAMSNDKARDLTLPTPSEEKMEFRRMFERQQLELANALGDDAGEEDWTEVYAKGGPFWLWSERRDIVMGLPYPTRQMMVADVEEDNAYLAHQMSIDILKREAGEPDFESGAGALAVGNVTSKSVRGG